MEKDQRKDNCKEDTAVQICLKEGKIEYLQVVQETISRMSTISAIFKGFAATIVAGIASLTYKDINLLILGLSFIPVILFACLDVYYLQLEKKYRSLYEEIRIDAHNVDFSLDLSIIDNETAKARFRDCLASPSIWLYYPVMILILIIVFILKAIGVI